MPRGEKAKFTLQNTQKQLIPPKMGKLHENANDFMKFMIFHGFGVQRARPGSRESGKPGSPDPGKPGSPDAGKPGSRIQTLASLGSGQDPAARIPGSREAGSREVGSPHARMPGSREAEARSWISNMLILKDELRTKKSCNFLFLKVATFY